MISVMSDKTHEPLCNFLGKHLLIFFTITILQVQNVFNFQILLEWFNKHRQYFSCALPDVMLKLLFY